MSAPTVHITVLGVGRHDRPAHGALACGGAAVARRRPAPSPGARPHSFTIALLRAGAAITVAAAHLRSELYPALGSGIDRPLWYQLLVFLTGFAHQGALVFFLVSGWLVGGALLERFGQPGAIRRYAIDRMTRLWVVLLPSLLFALAIGMISGTLDPRSPDASPANPYSLLAFAGNLIGLQSVCVPAYGGLDALWFLAYLSWSYLLFVLLLCFAAARTGRMRLGPGLSLLLLGILLPASLLLYAGLWLLGAGFSRLRIECSAANRWRTLALLVSLSVYWRVLGQADASGAGAWLQHLSLSLPLLVLISSAPAVTSNGARAGRRPGLMRRAVEALAAMSLSLYLIHLPGLQLVRHVLRVWLGDDRLAAQTPRDGAIFLAILAASILFAYGFHLLFEARTAALRQYVKQSLLGRMRARPDS